MSPKRTVTLPFPFGETVYFRGRAERIPGIVRGYVLQEQSMHVLVVWSDDLVQVEHCFFELTTEFASFTEE